MHKIYKFTSLHNVHKNPTSMSSLSTHQVEFYVIQTEADNHAVREAACACVAELGAKVERDVVRPHVSRLLDALIVCFQDESWPVRDGRAKITVNLSIFSKD